MATKERFEQAVAKCSRLRAAFAEAGVDFMVSVMQFEADESAWKSGVDGEYGWATFGEALHTSGLLLKHRLDKFKAAVEACGSIEEVRQIGMPAAEWILRIPAGAKSKISETSAREATMHELIEIRRRTGKEPTAWAAKSVATKYYALPKPDASERPESAYDRLVRENRDLKAQVKRLDADNARLREQVREHGGDPDSPGTARRPNKRKKNRSSN